MRSPAGRLLVLFLLILIIVAGVRAFQAWRNDPHLKIAAGSLVAMAADLDDGTFYRPLLGPDGYYGGTRYLPLYWSLIALLMKLGIPPVTAGYAVSFFSVALLLAGAYFLLRELGTSKALSACGALLLLSSETLQYLLITIRSDALATALGIWGIFLCLAGFRRRWCFVAAAACFSLAFATKATSEFALGAAVVALFLAGKKADSGKILGLTLVGFIAVLGVMYVGSAGRALNVIRECACAGYPPLGLFRGGEILLRTAWAHDQAGFLTLLLALATLVSLPARAWKETTAVLFLLTLCGTVFIFGYLAQDSNHLLDLDVASVLLVISALAGIREDAPSLAGEGSRFRLALLAFVVLLSVGWTTINLRHAERRPLRKNRIEVVRRLEGVHGPVLAENPLLPVLLHQKVYMLDPFMFGVLRKQDPKFAEPLLSKVRGRDLSAIVLSHDPRTAEGREFLSTVLFGEDFLKALDQYYSLSGEAGDNLIYLPRD
jgi:hypothetical protein